MTPPVITTTISRTSARRLIKLAGGTFADNGGWNLTNQHFRYTDDALRVALEELALSSFPER